MNVELNETVETLIKKQISDDRQIGLQVCAYQHGKKIVDTWAGTMGPNDDRQVKQDARAVDLRILSNVHS